MNVHFIIYVVSVVCFNSINCQLRFKKHVIRRQTQEMYQNSNQMSQASYVPQLESLDPKMNYFSDKTFLPPKITGFTPPNAVSQPGYSGLASDNSGPQSSIQQSGNLAHGQTGFGAGNVAHWQFKLTTEKVALGNVGFLPENTLPSNSGPERGNVATSNFELGPGNASPEFTAFPSINNVGSASKNLLQSNSGSAPENTSPSNSGSAPENAPLSNAGSAPENAPPSNAGSVPQNAMPSNTGSAPENAPPLNAASAPENAPPSNAGSASENAPPSNAGSAPQNAMPSNTGPAPENAPPSNAGSAPENAPPSNAGSAPKNTMPNNAGSAPENALLNNAGLATGNVAGSNSELAVGNESPKFTGFSFTNNLESAPKNSQQNNAVKAPENLMQKNAGLSNRNGPPGNVVFPSQNAALPSGNFRTSGSVGLSPLPNLLTTTSQALQNLNSNINSSGITLKRQKRNTPYKNDELDEFLETGKKLFRDSTGSNKRNEKHHLNFFDDYVEKELEANNATLIPIPKGVNIKTAAKQGNKEINSDVNITSSTQKTIIFGNTTEIENVLEMQMEKNIEDDKGANKGSEEVRIIETERVKPIVNKKLNGLTLQIRKRSYNNRFLTHRRNKRSIKFPTEPPRSNFVFAKMARRLKKRNSFPNRQMPSNFKANARRKIAISDTPTRDEPMPDKTEIDDFVKLFLKQLRKYRKSQRKKNDTTWLKELRTVEYQNDTKHPTRKSKTIKKNFELIKQVNVVMNLDLTWNTIMKDSVKSRNVTENQNKQTANVETAAPKISTQQIPQTLVYLGDRNDSGFKYTFLFLMIALLSTLMIWFIREKLRRLSDLNSKSRTFYHQGKGDKFKGFKYTRIGDACMNDYPQLEWQSENGDWLAEKDTDFK